MFRVILHTILERTSQSILTDVLSGFSENETVLVKNLRNKGYLGLQLIVFAIFKSGKWGVNKEKKFNFNLCI